VIDRAARAGRWHIAVGLGRQTPSESTKLLNCFLPRTGVQVPLPPEAIDQVTVSEVLTGPPAGGSWLKVTVRCMDVWHPLPPG
jgi:hypothetical protein